MKEQCQHAPGNVPTKVPNTARHENEQNKVTGNRSAQEIAKDGNYRPSFGN